MRLYDMLTDRRRKFASIEQDNCHLEPPADTPGLLLEYRERITSSTPVKETKKDRESPWSPTIVGLYVKGY
jgi:hypothetical protein